jgi:hypothetical protein
MLSVSAAMRPLANIKIGIRAQAIVVIASIVLWCVSVPRLIGFGGQGGLRLLDVPIAVCPVVALFFFLTLWWSYLHSARVYGGWVAAATLAIITPVFVYALFWLAYHI